MSSESLNDYTFYITLQKSDNYLTFASCDQKIYRDLIQALRKFCILEDFVQNYEMLDHLGSGHFSNVYLAKNKITNQFFAAKVINKTEEKFQHDKVSIFS